MNNVISTISAYALIGIFLFSLSVFLPANASMDSSKITINSMQGDHMTKVYNTTAMSDMTLKKQLMHSVSVHDIKCRTGFSLVLKLSDKSPACVKSFSVDKLVARGWAVSKNIMIKMMNDTMANETMNEDKGLVRNNMENKSLTKTMQAANNMKTSNDSHQMSQSSVNESKYPNAPALVGISDYINTTPAKLAQEMKGKVVVYDFWTFNCINCIHTLPHVVDLNNKYQYKGVLVIGIHSPETFVEKDPNNVRESVQKYNIKYPVVIDSEFQTWNAFGNHYWPHIYISDAQGKIRYDHIGEGAYDEIDNTVSRLLLEQENQKPKELVMG